MAAPAIGRRARWAPGPTATVDASHPLAARLRIFILFGHGNAVVFAKGAQTTAVAYNNSAPLLPAVAPTGPASLVDSSNTGYVQLTLPTMNGAVLPGQLTMAGGCAYLGSLTSYCEYHDEGGGQSGGAQNPMCNLGFDSTGHAKIRIGTGGFGGFNLVSAAVTPQGEWVTIVASSAASNHNLYVNGERVANSTSSSTTDWPATLQVGGDNNSFSGNSQPFGVSWFGAWQRALTANEAAALHADPFQMLRS